MSFCEDVEVGCNQEGNRLNRLMSWVGIAGAMIARRRAAARKAAKVQGRAAMPRRRNRKEGRNKLKRSQMSY